MFFWSFFLPNGYFDERLKLLEVKGDPSFERVEGRDTGGRRG